MFTREFITSALRYALAGIANTAVGFSAIVVLEEGLHVEAHLANALGYVLGACFSFLLSRFFVFREEGRSAALEGGTSRR